MDKINKFKYVKQQFKQLTETDAYSYSLDLVVTGLAIGTGLFLIKTSYSLAQGIGFAVIIALALQYIKELAEVVKDIKRTKSK